MFLKLFKYSEFKTNKIGFDKETFCEIKYNKI